MSRFPGLVFGGDRLHDGDVIRCERLLGAAEALWPASASCLLLGSGTVRQDAASVLADLRMRCNDEPRLSLAFSSNDPFSVHLARSLCVEAGKPLVGPVTAVRHHSIAAAQVLLVDERYFVRRLPDPSQTFVVAPCESSAATFVDVAAGAGEVPLEEADLVISAGDGVSDWESFSEVARLLGAAVGATKVVCDKGLQPRDRQVGSSGSAIAPRVYLAFGISGSTQHLQGVAESSRIMAVNIDPHASIMRRAELAVVADANALLRQLREVLEGAHA